METFGNPPLAQTTVSQEVLAELRNISNAGKNGMNELITYMDRLSGMTPANRNMRLSAIFGDTGLRQFIAACVQSESKDRFVLGYKSDTDRKLTKALGLLALQEGTSKDNIISIVNAFDNLEAPLPKDVVQEYKRQLASKPIEFRAEAEALPGYIKGTIALSEFRTALKGIGLIERS